MIDPRFVLLAVSFNILGAGIYLRRSFKGEVRPHPVTWFLWALAPSVIFVAQRGAGVEAVSWVTFITIVNPALIFLMSMRRRDAHWSVSRFDWICGILSLAGLAVWVIYRAAGPAIGLAITADFLAALPTYRKTLASPRSEAGISYACLLVSALIALATVQTWRFPEYAFLVYFAFLGATMMGAIAIGNLRSVAAE